MIPVATGGAVISGLGMLSVGGNEVAGVYVGGTWAGVGPVGRGISQPGLRMLTCSP